ncbi:MAG TPA: hypothetical protein VLJ37_01025 [bacterium]|nr:hypothetical protein [bacterium]
MSTPVRRLSISHPDLDHPVDVPLPWDNLPAAYQSILDDLDANDDGEVSYSPIEGGATAVLPVEAHHADGSAARLQQVLWGVARTYPANSRDGDRVTLTDRTRQIQTLQDQVFDNVVLPLLGDRRNIGRWRAALRLLSETGDYRHLYRLGVMARSQTANQTDFLRLSESLLLAAKRIAAPVRAARTQDFQGIVNELSEVQAALDAADRADFQRDARSPYLLAAPGSPISANLADLERENGTVTFAVAVPQAFIDAHPTDLDRAIADSLNTDGGVFARRSVFQDQNDGVERRLTAVSVERDAPGSADDPIGATSSFHLDHGRLGRTVFRGRPMTYFRVNFRLENPPEALGGRPIRKFDLVIRRGETTRTVPGSFVLQNMANTTSRDVFASDLHINERDYEIVRVMRSSLLSLANRYETDGILPDQVPILRSQAEEVERFYESVNERIEAAVDQWNEDYRAGRIHRVFLAGDLVDFVNIAGTLERQGYRGTNLRRFQEILGRLEAPMLVVSGNHDHHGYRFPLSLHRRNFINAGGLQNLYEMHYDTHRFPNSVLYFEGVKGLLPSSSSGDGWISDVIRELSADNPFGPVNDDFLDHHMRELGTYETYGTGLGNGFRVFAWPTETEHFNYARYLLEEVHDPVAPGVIDGIAQYVGRQHVNGKGPRPETFIAFLRELEAARSSGQRLILMGHYPPFFAGEGPDQTPDAADSLRGDAAWAVRLASWYYRRPNGEAVMPLAVSGHVHHYGESDFRFHFSDAAEEARFRTGLGNILQRKNAGSIFDDLHQLRHDWDLDNRIEIRRVQDPGSDGLPGPIMRDFNANSSSYCRQRGTAFVNLPSVGVPSEDGSGYLVLTTNPGGSVETQLKFYRMAHDGRPVRALGRDLEGFRRGRWNEDRAWDASRTMPAFAAHTQPTAVTTSGPGVPGSQPHWDFFPIVYQYPRGKIALTLDGGLEWDARSGRVSGMIGGQLLFPTTHHIHTVIGGPNYFAMGAEYSGLSNDLRVRIGLDWGLPTTYLTVNRLTSGNPAYGGEIFFHGIFPHAGLTVWGESTRDADWAAGLGLRLTLPLVTFRSSSGAHPDR